ncbi:MAG: hypothetical protein PHW01_00895 [Patescibacteria group bacterium]|nr:hypothetical protein [Patescibacteria group bacterium]
MRIKRVKKTGLKRGGGTTNLDQKDNDGFRFFRILFLKTDLKRSNVEDDSDWGDNNNFRSSKTLKLLIGAFTLLDSNPLKASGLLRNKHLMEPGQFVSPVRNKFLNGVREQGSLTGFTDPNGLQVKPRARHRERILNIR